MSLIDEVSRVQGLLTTLSQNHAAGSEERKAIDKASTDLAEFRQKLASAVGKINANTVDLEPRLLTLTEHMKTALNLVVSQSANPVLVSIARSGETFLTSSSAAYAKECAETLVNAPLVELSNAFGKVLLTLKAVEVQSSVAADIRAQELRDTFSKAAWPSTRAQELRDQALTYWQTCQNADGEIHSPPGFSFTGAWQSFRNDVEQPLTQSDIISRTRSYGDLAARIAVINDKLQEEINTLDGIIRALKIVSAFIGIALSIVELAAP